MSWIRKASITNARTPEASWAQQLVTKQWTSQEPRRLIRNNFSLLPSTSLQVTGHWGLELLQPCAHVCHVHPLTIWIWNIHGHPRCNWPFCFVSKPTCRSSRMSNQPCSHASCSIQRLSGKQIPIRKWKWGIYIRVNKHFRVVLCSCWWWDAAVWHLALPPASNRASLCWSCP